MRGRIWFEGSPWPDGHRIASFEWRGRLDPATGLWFDFDLQSADYFDEGGLEDDGEAGDGGWWESRLAWGNYGSCSLSSGEGTGVLAGTEAKPFALNDAGPQELHADPLPIDWSAERAFHVYLLGHDTVADHRIRFSRGASPGAFGVAWEGRIALTYSGDDEFRHGFRAEIEGARLDAISIPAGMTGGEALAVLARFVDAPERFAPGEVYGRAALVRREPRDG